MKYSVIKVNNESMSYCVNNTEIPPPNGVEGVRDFLSWQQTLKIYPVSEKDKKEIYDYIAQQYPDTEFDYANNGVNIPFTLMEIITKDGKEYARKNNKVVIDNHNGKIGFNVKCLACHNSYFVDSSNFDDKERLPLCVECTDVLVALILNERVKKVKTNE